MKMRRTCFAILAAPLISVAAAQPQTNRACHDADLVVRDAKIVTMDATRSVATSMAIRNGRILTVGTPKDVASCIGSYTSVLDLHGQTVLPGLIDIHTQAAEWMARRFRNNVDLSDPKLRSIEDVAKAIAAVVASSPKGKWIRGSGWSEAGLAERRYINRKDLDAVSPDNPVWLLQFSGHLAVVNTAALELAGISRDTPNPPGGVIDKDEAGEPTGVLKDNAVDVVAALVPFVFSFGSRFAKFGPARVRWIFPEKAYLENGIVAGAGSDVPITLEPGKLADFVVIDRDVLSVSSEELKDVKVLKTFVGGELVYESRP